ncbi:SpoIIE family protein phosphatase [Kitasatospora arboriphila]|uniref:SpoIIE family protein phosphatase n=2 Tax=Kitasatospora TaxID=2063 RepID=A0ABN1TBR5_9ACTN
MSADLPASGELAADAAAETAAAPAETAGALPETAGPLPESGAAAELPLRGPRRTAGPAPGVLGRLASTVERLRREVREAQAAADGRALIELAKGILIGRLTCGPAEAEAQLAALAERANVTVLELAADIINQAAQDGIADTAREFVAAGGPAPHGADRSAPAEPVSPALRLRTAEAAAMAGDDIHTVARSVLDHALAPLDAGAAVIWEAQPDGSLRLAGSAGFTAEEAARWHYVPPGVPTPARSALTARDLVRFDSVASGPPGIGRRQLTGTRIAVPAGFGGRLTCVLEICWAARTAEQPPAVLRQFEALAELCARALESAPEIPPGALIPAADARLRELLDLVDGLHDPGLLLKPLLDDRGAVADFLISHVNTRFVDFAGRPAAAVAGATLLEAYPLSAEPGGLFQLVEHVHATGEPYRSANLGLTALIDDVPLTTTAEAALSRHGDHVVCVWRTRDESSRVASLLQHAQRLGRIGGFEEDLRTGAATWNETVFDLYGLPPTAPPVTLDQLAVHCHPDDRHAIGRFVRTLLHHRRPADTAFRLNRPDGVVRHIRIVAEPVLDQWSRLTAVRGAYQDVSAQHWTEVALAATREQLAHTEEQAAARNRLALQLQHAIMPVGRGPLDLTGLRIAVRYRPAEKDHMVGGDWYDAVTLPSKRILLCVGDVAGHGIEAATGMVALRNALRGLAATGSGPAQLLGWLNNVTHHLTDHVTATAVCALYDPADRTLSWARAGHLPPVLLRRGRAETVPPLGGILLGALADADYEEGTLQLEAGDTLMMYTDGLIERKDRTLQESLDGLVALTERAFGAARDARDPAPLERHLDHLLTHSSADTDDDTCLIGIQVC